MKIAALIAGALVAGAAIYLWPEDRSARPPGGQGRESPTTVDGRCRGIGRLRSGPQITFVQGQRLLATDPTGKRVRCLVEDVDGAPRWGPDGDRLLVGSSTYFANGETAAVNADAEWSRPRGESLVWVERGRLMKMASRGGSKTDISFLQRHDDVVYHPSGTHVASSGRNSAGEYGVFIATNLGQKPFPVARGETARRIDGLQFSADGLALYFVADHRKFVDLHRVEFIKTPDGVRLEHIETVMTAKPPAGFGSIRQSPYSMPALVAFTRGDCSVGTETFIWEGALPKRIEWPDAEQTPLPLGWLPDGRLVVEVTMKGFCSGGGTLAIWDPETKQSSPIPGATDVTGFVSLRVDLPKVADPPRPADEGLA